MPANLFSRSLLIPALALALAGTIAVAQDTNPSTPPDAAHSAQVSPPDTMGSPEPPVQTEEHHNAAAPEAQTEAGQETGKEMEKAAPVLDSVGEGKMLFETRCGTCHSVPRPNAHTLPEWPECLNRMAPRASLGDAEVKLMYQYLEQELKSPSASEWDEKEG